MTAKTIIDHLNHYIIYNSFHRHPNLFIYNSTISNSFPRQCRLSRARRAEAAGMQHLGVAARRAGAASFTAAPHPFRIGQAGGRASPSEYGDHLQPNMAGRGPWSVIWPNFVPRVAATDCIGPGHRRKCCRGRQHVPGGRLRAGCSTWERLCVVGQAPEALSGHSCVVGGGSPARSGATDKLSWPDIDLFRRFSRSPLIINSHTKIIGRRTNCGDFLDHHQLLLINTQKSSGDGRVAEIFSIATNYY